MGTLYRNSNQYSSNNSDTAPVGSVLSYASDIIPIGWLLCDGRAVSRTDYALLFSVIGTKYGEGDGSTTFNLPDLVDKFPLGKGESRDLGTEGGEETHTLKESEMPKHIHSAEYTWSGSSGSKSIWRINMTNTSAGSAGSWPSSDTGTSAGYTGGSQPHNNMPPYQTVNYIIKYTYVNQFLTESVKINDALTTNSNTWSAEKIDNEIELKQTKEWVQLWKSPNGYNSASYGNDANTYTLTLSDDWTKYNEVMFISGYSTYAIPTQPFTIPTKFLMEFYGLSSSKDWGLMLGGYSTCYKYVKPITKTTMTISDGGGSPTQGLYAIFAR